MIGAGFPPKFSTTAGIHLHLNSEPLDPAPVKNHFYAPWIDNADDSIWGAAGRHFVSAPKHSFSALLAHYLTRSSSFSPSAPLVTGSIITGLPGCKASERKSTSRHTNVSLQIRGSLAKPK